MQGIAVINCPVLKAVAGEVRQQQILVGDLDPIRIHLSFIDVVSGDRRHQIEHISRIHFINRIILAVPKFDTGVCQYQRSAGSSVIVCRYRKQHRRQAGHDHQDCQQDTDDSCTQVSCLFCLHKKTPLIAGTLHAVCFAFFRANFMRRFLRFFARENWFPVQICTVAATSTKTIYIPHFLQQFPLTPLLFNCSIVSTIKRTFWHKSRKLL